MLVQHRIRPSGMSATVCTSPGSPERRCRGSPACTVMPDAELFVSTRQPHRARQIRRVKRAAAGSFVHSTGGLVARRRPSGSHTGRRIRDLPGPEMLDQGLSRPVNVIVLKRCSCQFPAPDHTGRDGRGCRDDRGTRGVLWSVTEPCLRMGYGNTRTRTSAVARRRLGRDLLSGPTGAGASRATADEPMRTPPGPRHRYQQGGCRARDHRQ